MKPPFPPTTPLPDGSSDPDELLDSIDVREVYFCHQLSTDRIQQSFAVEWQEVFKSIVDRIHNASVTGNDKEMERALKHLFLDHQLLFRASNALKAKRDKLRRETRRRFDLYQHEGYAILVEEWRQSRVTAQQNRQWHQRSLQELPTQGRAGGNARRATRQSISYEQDPIDERERQSRRLDDQICDQIRQGNVKRALRWVGSKGVANPSDPRVEAQLVGKFMSHRVAPFLERLDSLVANCEDITITPETCKKVMRTLDVSKSRGVNGMSMDLFKLLLISPEAPMDDEPPPQNSGGFYHNDDDEGEPPITPALGAFATLTHLFVNHKLPPYLYRLVGGAHSVPLIKKEAESEEEAPDCRPVAVVDSIVRVMSQVALRSHKGAVTKCCIPEQLGIGTQSGVQKQSMIMQLTYQRCQATSLGDDFSDWLIVKFDLKNAHNSFIRAKAMEAIQAVPELRPLLKLFKATFGYSTQICVRDFSSITGFREITSVAEAGLQGHPLTSYAFGLTLDPILKEMNSFLTPGFITAIQDDMCVAGPAEKVKEMIPLLQQRLEEIGLSFATGEGKNRAVSPFNQYPDDLPDFIHIAGGERVDMGLELCGTPVGSAEFAEKYVNARAAEIAVTIEEVIPRLAKRDAQVAFYVLTKSMGTKANWLWQTNPPSITQGAARVIESALRRGATACLGITLDQDVRLCQNPPRIHSPADKCSFPLVEVNSAPEFTLSRVFAPLRDQGSGLILPLQSHFYQSAFISSVLDCIPSFISYTDPDTQEEVQGLCDFLQPIIGSDRTSLEVLCSVADHIPLAQELITSYGRLREARMQGGEVPEDVLAFIGPHMFQRQRDQLALSSSKSPLLKAESLSQLNPLDFSKNDSKLGRLIQRDIASNNCLFRYRQAHHMPSRRDPRRLALLNCDDVSVSLFSRPCNDFILSSQCFQTRAQLLMGVPLNILTNREGEAIRRNQTVDRNGYTLHNQSDTTEGHRSRFHNAVLSVVVSVLREARYHVSRVDNGRILTEGLTAAQCQTLAANNQSAASKIIADVVTDLGEDLEEFTSGQVQDTRVLGDVKTIGFPESYRQSSCRGHRTSRSAPLSGPCPGVNDRGRKVHREYRTKAKNCDQALGIPVSEMGPVEAKLRSFAPVYGLAVGPFAEISGDFRKLLKPAIKRIARRRRSGMVIHNLTIEHTEAAMYNGIRRRIGLTAHTEWFRLLTHSLKLVSRSHRGNAGEFVVNEAADAVADEAAFQADGALGV